MSEQFIDDVIVPSWMIGRLGSLVDLLDVIAWDGVEDVEERLEDIIGAARGCGFRLGRIDHLAEGENLGGEVRADRFDRCRLTNVPADDFERYVHLGKDVVQTITNGPNGWMLNGTERETNVNCRLNERDLRCSHPSPWTAVWMRQRSPVGREPTI